MPVDLKKAEFAPAGVQAGSPSRTFHPEETGAGGKFQSKNYTGRNANSYINRGGGPSVFDRRIQTWILQMDQYVVPQPAGGSAGERRALGGVRVRAVGRAELPLVTPCLCLRFEAPAP